MGGLFGNFFSESQPTDVKPIFDHQGEPITFGGGINIPILDTEQKKNKAAKLVDFLKTVQEWQVKNAGTRAVEIATDFDPKEKYLCWIRVDIEYLSEKFEVEDDPNEWIKKWNRFLVKVKEDLSD